jgi:predicted DCC family thiol-disulfide oxidoreductase YuxK
MKPSNKIIIYDDACPMCATYTNAFVKCGFIKNENRVNFTTITPQLLSIIDIEKSKNEIPVIDSDTNEVYYGIDGLLEILNTKISFIKSLGNVKPIKWFLQKLYKFISFNRRVIVATEPATCNFNCTPQLNVKYRLFFALFFLLFNTIMLFPLHTWVIQNSIFKVDVIQLQIAHFLLVASNLLVAICINKRDAIEYIGQVNMLATLVIILFVPLIIINKIANEPLILFNNAYMLGLTIFISNEYIRRMKFAHILPNYKWVPIVNAVCIFTFIVYLIV